MTSSLKGSIEPLHVRENAANLEDRTIRFFYMRIDLNSQKIKCLLFYPPNWLHSHDVQGVYSVRCVCEERTAGGLIRKPKPKIAAVISIKLVQHSLPYICLIFSGFSNVQHFACFWSTALNLGCITNFDMLS